MATHRAGALRRLVLLATLVGLAACEASSPTRRVRAVDGGLDGAAGEVLDATRGDAESHPDAADAAPPALDAEPPPADALPPPPDAPLALGTLTVSTSGSGSGTVSADSGDIDCGSDCDGSYAPGTVVTLTAIPASGSRFTGWTGACTGTALTCDVTVDEAGSFDVGAAFELVPHPALGVTLAGTGVGHVVSDSGGIDCPDACSAEYDENAVVTLTAVAEPSSDFTGWTGACTGSEAVCEVTLGAAASVEATFTLKEHTLTLTTSGDGQGTLVPTAPAKLDCAAGCVINHGTEVTLKATPKVGLIFLGWSGGSCSGSDTTCTVTMDDDRDVDAVFSKQAFGVVVTRTGTGSGSVTSVPAGIACAPSCTSGYPFGTSVVLTAKAAVGSTFAGFSGCDSAVGTKCTLAVDGAKNVTARFDVQRFVLDVEKGGNGTGTVGADLGAIACGATCSDTYDHGTTVTLTAVPGANSRFVAWQDCPEIQGASCVVQVTEASTVTANFALLKRALTVVVAGDGAGVVAGSGIACGADCAESFDHGTLVTLTATPAGSSTLTGFSGCKSVSGNTCTVTLDATKTVTATFTLKQIVLTTALAGNGAGSVSSAPAGIACGADCSESYDYGTDVVLTAAPGAGSTFGGWTGCPSVSGSTCTVSARAARTVTATFTLKRYALTVALAGNGAGAVGSAPTGIACGADCSEIYDHGTSVVLTGTPGRGSSFTSWTNCPLVNGNKCTVALTAARTVTATFSLNKVTLDTVLAGTGTGTITSVPTGITCGADCTQPFDFGTSVVLTAAPAATSTFTSWTGCPTPVGATCTVPMTAARSVTATFTVRRFTLSVTTNSSQGTGTVASTDRPQGILCGADCSQVYPAGTTVGLVATPDPRMVFTGWTGCPRVNRDGSCSVTVNRNLRVDAVFDPNQPPVVAITSPADGTPLSSFWDPAVGLYSVTVTLQGNATDPEDGALTGTSLTWTTDNADQPSPTLGTGDTITVPLYVSGCFGGSHNVSLTATDSNGLSQSATIRLDVFTDCIP